MDNTKNRGINLHNMLFIQLEELADAKKSDIDFHLKKAKGMCDVADKLISLADLQLRATQIQVDSQLCNSEMPRLLACQLSENS